MASTLYKLIFFAPKENAAEVSQEMFKAGAGQIGDYDSCCFMTEGTGQFRPGEGSHPHIGSQNQLEYVAETKVEMVCAEEKAQAALQAMKDAHPYEEPAYDVLKLANDTFPLN